MKIVVVKRVNPKVNKIFDYMFHIPALVYSLISIFSLIASVIYEFNGVLVFYIFSIFGFSVIYFWFSFASIYILRNYNVSQCKLGSVIIWPFILFLLLFFDVMSLILFKVALLANMIYISMSIICLIIFAKYIFLLNYAIGKKHNITTLFVYSVIFPFGVFFLKNEIISEAIRDDL